jgi:hypothetical protein
MQTDSYIDIVIDEEVVDRIGLSAALSDITDISGVCFCGQYNNQLQNPGLYETLIPDSQVVNRKTPLKWDGSGFPIELSYGDNSAYTAPNGMYGGVVWLYYIDGDDGNIPPDYCITANKISKYKLVTEWDAPHYVHYPEDPSKNSGEALYQYRYSSWSDTPTTYGIYDNYYGLNFKKLEYWSDNLKTDYVVINDIYPYQILEFNGKLYLLAFQYNHTKQGYYDSDSQTNNYSPYNLSYDSSERFASSLAFPHGTFDDGGTISSDNLPYSISSYNHLFVGVSADGNFIGEVETNSSDLPDADGRLEMESWIYFHSRDAVYQYTANSGLKFYTDKLYKPIINNGIVTGFTDDMAEPSELDSWTGTTNHGISPTPPTPPTPGDDEDNTDPIPTVGAPYSSGLARYYVTTAGSVILNHISSAMGAWNLKDSGKDLYKNIISCKLIKSPAPIPVSGSEPFTVYGVTLQYEGSDITLPLINDNPTASFGSYNIPRKFNDFRDYAPYTKVEIYLPYCGWTVLPSHVVGRSVSVTYYTDIIAATCKAIVYCGSNVVAEAAGVIGLDIPMVTENAGAKAEAVTMGLLAYGKAGLQTALGVGAAVATKGKAGVKQAVSGLGDVVSAYSQTAMAFNQNYTEINGKNGDGCCIAGISAIVIKITRPKYGSNTTAPYVPSNYAHSTGYVSMKSATVGSFTGLLVADNVDTSGISGATEREKQLIKLYLESGVFVNHPN